ncbi:PTS lactose/cellobiose transporter subunit IIA [Tepidanaerobacter sp. EBM-38]|uniref:PTS lactose/cellobiose transporter subunit IIA n=1 Tax=Tepidanaerobacter sp. EBM-38 TaxID=1918496 RepID=UPI000ABD9C3A|nr:PTS lactose/cellobiose transporter subunit IIA [Tepidanaerobacter sp. EBM-38]
MDCEKIILSIIAHAGNARSLCFEALRLAKEGNLGEAHKKINETKEELLNAHKIQSNMLHKEAAGEKHEISLLLIHAQDHLMAAMLAKDLIEEFIELYEKVFQNEEHIN